jgi:DNA-binding response OmpR family regulator
MKKILILEDDKLLAKTLKIGLENRQNKILAINRMEDFYRLIEKENLDLCVMDRMIAEEDSADSVEYLREINPQVRILMLSKKSEAKDKIEGLELGADDYLAKPFSLAEFRLRVKSLLSLYRSSQEEKGIPLGELTFYPEQGLIRGKVDEVALRRRETQILACLARAMGRVVSRDKISRTLWPEDFEPNPNTVDVYIRRLRQKLGSYQAIIQTRRGFGYFLIPFEGKE